MLNEDRARFNCLQRGWRERTAAGKFSEVPMVPPEPFCDLRPSSRTANKHTKKTGKHMTHRQSTIPAACLTAFVMLAGCDKPTTEPAKSEGAGTAATTPAGTVAKSANQALVRFINATAAPKDLAFGEMRPFPAVPANSASAYTQIPSERHDFKLLNSGGNLVDPLVKNSESPTAGMHYSVLAISDKDGKYSLKVLDDDLSRPAAGKAKIRVVHAAAGLNKVDVYPVNSKEALLSGVDFDSATSYKEVDPGTMELDLRIAGSKKNLHNIKEVRLDPGKLYTVIIFGGPASITAKVIEDQLLPN
ncbi:MAG: DUF4397 domain-containing protein [Bryobacteraceae bacterium]